MTTKKQMLRAWLSQMRRALSSVIGVSLMIVIVVLLASVMAGLVLTYGNELERPEMTDSGPVTTDSGSEATGSRLNPWDNEEALLAPENPTAGAEDVRYRVIFEIQEQKGGDSNDAVGNSLNDVLVSVDDVDRRMFSGVTKSDVEKFEVERENGDTEKYLYDVEDEENWSIDNDNNELKMTLSGNYDIQAGDVITIIIDSIDNPAEPGTYDIAVELNDGEDTESGTLEIVSE